MSTSGLAALHAGFLHPGRAFGPMPFFWWSGGVVDREKLRWQLDLLAASGVAGTVVGYSHRTDSSLDADDPQPLTEEWWDLFAWYVEECAERGLTVGLQDYILLNDILRAAGEDTPSRGSGTLQASSTRVTDSGPISVDLPADAVAVVAVGPDGELTDLVEPPLGEALEADTLTWTAPGPGWEVLVVTVAPPVLYGEPLTFDVLHPDSGQAVIDRLYDRAAERLGDHLGSTFTTFFQDELDLGVRMPMWSARLPEEFRRRKGYDVVPLLAALWRDIGPRTHTVRLDYTDVVTALLEESYFAPIHAWHRAHGTVLAMDQLGRGEPRTGHRVYADYARTMRWFDAPGNEDPKLHEPRRLETFKVNSSLAHLYERPRVWNEAFHSSGWGITPAEVIAGLDQDFAFGATSISLHGLYHSTRGGWWEWASPDFHFRQPYWDHAEGMWQHITRLSWLISQGHHACDVAVLDPASDVAASPAPVTGEDSPPDLEPESAEVAMGIIRELVTAGCDVDVLDDDSLARARPIDGRLCVAGERYRVVVVPAMRHLRASSVAALTAFVRAGGVVLAYGRLPETSSLEDVDLPALVPFATAPRTPGSVLLEAIDATVVRDVVTGTEELLVNHRRGEDFDAYLIVNVSDRERRVRPSLPARGRLEHWDPQDGSRRPCPATLTGDRLEVDLHLLPGQSALLVAGSEDAPDASAPAASSPAVPVATLEGPWAFRLTPTIDNRFGDFRLPPGPLGVEAHELDLVSGDSTDRVRVTYGPRMWWLGPLSPAAEPDPETLLAGPSGGDRVWAPYVFSDLLGIEGDPLLQDLQTGPHGLKGEVPLEFIDLGAAEDVAPGSVSYLWTSVHLERDEDLQVTAGSRSAFTVWVDGVEVVGQAEALAPVSFPPWDVPDTRPPTYTARAHARAGTVGVLVRLVHPSEGRLRGFVSLGIGSAPSGETEPVPALRWWSGERPALPFDPRPDVPGVWAEYVLTAPPGLIGLSALVHGDLELREPATAPVHVERTPVDGGPVRFEARWDAPLREATPLHLWVRPLPGREGGGAFAAPLTFTCADGTAHLGDWSALGLSAYSGKATYSRDLQLDMLPAGRLLLDLGEVATTAAVRIDGVQVGTAIAPPYRVDVTGHLRAGSQRLEIEVANTLAGFYSTLPTPFVRDGQGASGLIGPVTLQVEG